MAPRKGRRKDRPPIARLGLRCLRSDSGSISAPARKVRSPEPKVARKSIQGVVWNPRKLPPMTPTNISTSATEIPSLMEMTLATSASPIQAAATNHMFSMRGPPVIECQSPGEPEGAGELKLLTAHPGVIRSHQRRCGLGGANPAPADSIAGLLPRFLKMYHSHPTWSSAHEGWRRSSTLHRPGVEAGAAWRLLAYSRLAHCHSCGSDRPVERPVAACCHADHAGRCSAPHQSARG